MKNILSLLSLMIVMVVPTISIAGTPITNEMVDKYYGSCVELAKKEGTMTSESTNRYCACTAMNMQKSMTQEDLTDLSGTGVKQRTALNKMLIDVNGPCMSYPVKDLLNNKCMTDVKNKEICSCLSTKMGVFMAEITKRMMPELLADDPNLFDPMTPIMESPEFQQRQQQIAISCATEAKQK
jgi:hypothetical protein